MLYEYLTIKMLSSLVKEHQAKQAVRKESQGMYFFIHYYTSLLMYKYLNNCFHTKCVLLPDIKRKEAVNAANELTNALVEHLNVG